MTRTVARKDIDQVELRRKLFVEGIATLRGFEERRPMTPALVRSLRGKRCFAR
jgi:hypothetical protein